MLARLAKLYYIGTVAIWIINDVQAELYTQRRSMTFIDVDPPSFYAIGCSQVPPVVKVRQQRAQPRGLGWCQSTSKSRYSIYDSTEWFAKLT